MVVGRRVVAVPRLAHRVLSGSVPVRDGVDVMSGPRAAVSSGLELALQQVLAERSQPCHCFGRGLVPAGQRTLDLPDGGGLEPAAAAVLQVRCHAPGVKPIEVTIQVGLEDTGYLLAVQQALAGCAPAPRHRDHVRRPSGATPAAASLSRTSLRARCSRLITVPAGTPSSFAASAYDRPLTSTRTTTCRCLSGSAASAAATTSSNSSPTTMSSGVARADNASPAACGSVSVPGSSSRYGLRRRCRFASARRMIVSSHALGC